MLGGVVATADPAIWGSRRKPSHGSRTAACCASRHSCCSSGLGGVGRTGAGASCTVSRVRGLKSAVLYHRLRRWLLRPAGFRPADRSSARTRQSCAFVKARVRATLASRKRSVQQAPDTESDSQKCIQLHWITTADGAMCGRCMKTCPWKLERAARRYVRQLRNPASNVPVAAKWLARRAEQCPRRGVVDSM